MRVIEGLRLNNSEDRVNLQRVVAAFTLLPSS